jgi:UDP-N-acetylmuramate: L-alanyl-gamma-D-glutamyl-meso-diaminopimelate ligase
VHVHILGIAGTFMGGIAAIAQAAGHRVTGSDRGIYPPMSEQLAALGIGLVQGYEAAQLQPRPDIVVVGNALSRGVPVIEELLDLGLPYVSGPEWLAEHVLQGRHVLAVAGTHGKTTTTSMLAWILESAGLAPGFLIGGLAANFATSARLGDAPYFVIEADEYDTAFFDKRAKFVHYRPRTAILGNLEYDHADIYADVAAIRWQFHQLLRCVPASGRVIVNGADANLAETLTAGCWTPVERFALPPVAGDWSAHIAPGTAQRRFEVIAAGSSAGWVDWSLIGEHNVMNALAAIAAAAQAGVAPAQSVRALSEFRGVRRRLEVRGVAAGVTVYDDFAHHPTAIRTTLAGLRAAVAGARIIAVLEPRSNTMKLGVHRETLAESLRGADESWLHAPADLGWDLEGAVRSLGARAHCVATIESLVAELAATLRAGDHVLVMSNGGFGGLHAKLLDALRARETA